MKSLFTKLINLIKLGYISRSLPDTNDEPLTQVSYFNTTLYARVISPYGLYSNLPENTGVILWNVNGHETNPAAMGYYRQDRFKGLASGEVLTGNPITKSYIKFTADGKIEIISTGDVDLTVSGTVNIDAAQTNLGVGGNDIARSGDPVKVNVAGTDYFGTITAGGTNTST